MYIQMSISDGLGSRKLEILADTAVTLEQNTEGAVVTEVIKKILKVWHSVWSHHFVTQLHMYVTSLYGMIHTGLVRAMMCRHVPGTSISRSWSMSLVCYHNYASQYDVYTCVCRYIHMKLCKYHRPPTLPLKLTHTYHTLSQWNVTLRMSPQYDLFSSGLSNSSKKVAAKYFTDKNGPKFVSHLCNL